MRWKATLLELCRDTLYNINKFQLVLLFSDKKKIAKQLFKWKNIAKIKMVFYSIFN